MANAPAPSPLADPIDEASIFDSLVPGWIKKFLLDLPGVKQLAAWPEERRDLVLFCLLAAALIIPWLGAVGLWDPWEPHYGEVAREMVYRHDYVYPFWESAYFFSKPILLMWLMTLGMNLVGINHPAPGHPLPLYTEWAMRLPVAILAIAGAAVLFLAIRRIFGRRLAFLTGFVLVTSPHFFFLARQCMEDMPLMACLEISLGSFLIAELSRKPDGSRADPFWWYLMYAAAAYAALAKESLGIALPGLVVFTYLLLSWDWSLLKRARLVRGALLFLAIAAPWYVVLILFKGHDDEWSTFALRLAHDNTDRFFTSTVHTTTPAWTFTYFIEQLGWGFFPWVALLPGAVAVMSRLDWRAKDEKTRASLAFAGWAIAVFVFFSFSGTKFHHYIFPVFPALAFCVAAFIDRLWRDGVEKWLVAVLAGLGILGLVAQNLYLWHDDMGVHSGLKHFTDLFVYNYTRPYPFEVDRPDVFGTICIIGGVWIALAFLWRSKKLLFVSFAGFSLAIAIWGSWFFWRWMSPHWSQRDEFWAYYEQRLPKEPIAAYLMNWRGETFYSRNTVQQIRDPGKLREFVSQPGPEFVIVEQARFPGMRQVLGEQYRYRIADRSSNKFFMVEISNPCQSDGDCAAPQACDRRTQMCVAPWETRG